MADFILDETISDKELKSINRFWLGFVIYTMGYILTKPPTVNFILIQTIQCVGLFILIPATAGLIRYNLENRLLKIIYPVYCIWLLITVVRGFNFNSGFLKGMLFDAWFGVFLYFVPLLLLFPKKIIFYKKAFNAAIVLGIANVILDVVFIRQLLNPDITNLASQAIIEYFAKTLAVPCGFILLTYLYHTKRVNLIALGVMTLTFLLATIRARRGLMFMVISPLVIAYFIYLFTNRGNTLKWIFSLMLVGVVVAYGYKVYNKNKFGLFDSITNRADEDTRTGVELYFYADMDTNDWIFGKGVDGEYYCPGIDGMDSVYRTTIETDYLQLILKGGIISLGLLLLIAIPAVFKGLFSSRNILSKAAAIWILLWMIDLYPATVTTFTLNYVLVWISIGICYSNEIRNIPEDEMRSYFQLPITEGSGTPDKLTGKHSVITI